MTKRPTPADWAREHHRGGEPHLLREVMRLHQALLAVFSREVGLAASRLSLLRTLAIAGPSGIGVMALARQLGVDAAAVSRQVAALEREGLIERRADPRDARRSALRLAARGVRAFEAVHDRAHEFERSLTSVVSEEELEAAARVLARVREVVEARR